MKLANLAALARDAVGLVGLGAITYGAYLVYAPAGYITGGLFALTGAGLLAVLDLKKSS